MSNPDLSGMLYGWYWSTAYGVLTTDQRLHNAQLAVNILCLNGFTHAAAAGIVGNMWAESSMSLDAMKTIRGWIGAMAWFNGRGMWLKAV